MLSFVKIFVFGEVDIECIISGPKGNRLESLMLIGSACLVQLLIWLQVSDYCKPNF